jgi:hypothetical protein
MGVEGRREIAKEEVAAKSRPFYAIRGITPCALKISAEDRLYTTNRSKAMWRRDAEPASHVTSKAPLVATKEPEGLSKPLMGLAELNVFGYSRI